MVGSGRLALYIYGAMPVGYYVHELGELGDTHAS